jgi:hypothetical protein
LAQYSEESKCLVLTGLTDLIVKACMEKRKRPLNRDSFSLRFYPREKDLANLRNYPTKKLLVLQAAIDAAMYFSDSTCK